MNQPHCVLKIHFLVQLNAHARVSTRLTHPLVCLGGRRLEALLAFGGWIVLVTLYLVIASQVLWRDWSLKRLKVLLWGLLLLCKLWRLRDRDLVFPGLARANTSSKRTIFFLFVRSRCVHSL